MARNDDSPIDEPKPIKKKSKPVILDDDDDEPVRPKKKKRKRPAYDDSDEMSRIDQLWWILPAVLIVVGLIMSLVGSAGFMSNAKNNREQVGTLIVLVITFVQFLVSIPINIAALFVGGKILGIEYGSPLQAILGIAAIGSMMMGLDWLLTWFGLWRTAVMVITFIAGFSLFMTLFKLDNWEVWASIICIKILTVVSYVVVILFVFGALNAASR